ncbi:flagellar biosynthesis repressor FlbT (plasmid) [Paroceanicella profunda]|uniref:Flagellar biosynthesis repressor FlbT n=1 Tax=Paroceanicella profunda TaxID=2579971 RepID=A0A5B8G3Q9_9RHOB|nr:flagellar biosynthesis repressor FlbT [Paroceanicella profunda]QDL94774.1 flagellar biosynthesis repressor FlbT [Paroceanicella profunda]
MPGLILKLTPGERFMVNGVVMENGDHRARICVVTENANVLRLRDAIHPGEVNTPVRRVCYIAQLVLAGEAEESLARQQLLTGIEQLSQVFTDADSRTKLDAATSHAMEAKYYPALKALRSLLSREARLMQAMPRPPSETRVAQ